MAYTYNGNGNITGITDHTSTTCFAHQQEVIEKHQMMDEPGHLRITKIPTTMGTEWGERASPLHFMRHRTGTLLFTLTRHL